MLLEKVAGKNKGGDAILSKRKSVGEKLSSADFFSIKMEEM